MPLRVYGSPSLADLRPVRGGVPLAEGAAPAGAVFALTDAAGAPLPLQTEVLATWPDGSAKWVLLDFIAAPPPGGAVDYTLRWDGAPAAAPDASVAAAEGMLRVGDAAAVSTGGDSLLTVGDGLATDLLVEDEHGVTWRAQAEHTAIAAAGPVRGTLCLSGAFRNEGGERWFDFRLWVSAFAGLPRLLLEPLVIINADQGLVQRLRRLRVVFHPRAGVATASVGGADEAGLPLRLVQVDDEQLALNGQARAGQAPGWVEVPGQFAVALRDFWQQWPKGFTVDAEGVSLELLPPFTPGTFDHMGPWYKHDYLFEGDCYRLRTGQARRWQVWLDPQGDGPALAEAANVPLVVSADPATALATGVWGPQMPAGPSTAAYDTWAEQLFDVYMLSLKKHRDYGAMNWGDWWGERRSNWGNHEYDTPLHMLVQFARTGDPKYLRAGDITARHMAEVDVVHAANEDLARYYREDIGHGLPARPGIVHQHCIGHVGGFHPVEQIRELYVGFYREAGHDRPNPYLCLDPNNLGHVFTQGMAYHYLLTGDPWVRETLTQIGANLCALIEEQAYQFKGWDHCGRVNGWTMLALAGCHDVAPAERLMAAMRSLADDALSEQDPNCGGWLYELPWGHCYCETRKHVGEAGFISAVRVNGLARYYGLTGDERIPEAVRRAVTHLNNDTWREQDSDWRYTSCPATSLMRQFGVIMMALRNSVVLTGDEEQLRILRQAWQAKLTRLQEELGALLTGDDAPWFGKESMGKEYGATAYGCGETMGLLASLDEC
ncbi:hypothetical protein LLH23_12055 [bacterium]|nr:hypothetical protein [bacterium]